MFCGATENNCKLQFISHAISLSSNHCASMELNMKMDLKLKMNMQMKMKMKVEMKMKMKVEISQRNSYIFARLMSGVFRKKKLQSKSEASPTMTGIQRQHEKPRLCPSVPAHHSSRRRTA